MDQLVDYLASVEIREPEIVAFLKQLIKTPSLSGEEGEIAGIVSDKLRELGYGVDVDGMGNVIAQRGKGRGKTILFDGHLDHVQPGALEAWSHGPYDAEVVDGVLFGRATVDMKGALAAMIYGCAAPDVDGTVIMTFVVHEETNEGVATKKIIEDKGLSIDACVLGEPTDLQLSVGQRGRCVFKITTKGATSHASMPELGVNALYLMTPIIERIKDENQNLPTHPFLGQGSMAVTTLRCLPGTGPIVPDHCEIEVDRRLVPQETLEGVLEEMRGLAPGAQVELLVDELKCYTGYTAKADQYFPGWIIDEDHWAVQESLEALTDGMSRKPDIIGWRFSTDGIATAGQLGIPTVGFGPGDPALAHQPNEYIRLDDVVAAAKGYCALAYRLAS
ncbi:MAG: YgeY family selenium metabolism-linked hydrolase [Candidatus Bathyarchaeota archaeon]|nr:YgeY family selenium metabolism-linked hydrolase [Candidatus Bathyarchaeota archaeon]